MASTKSIAASSWSPGVGARSSSLIAAPLIERAVSLTSRARLGARSYPVEEQLQLAPAFAAMERDHMQALILLPDAWFYPLRSEVVRLAADRRLPAIYSDYVAGFCT